MQSELRRTKHYANTQQQLHFLPLWILLSGYTVQTCSYLSLELSSFHLSSLTVDHSPFTPIQIKLAMAQRITRIPRQSGGVGTFDTTLLIIALMVHIFIQAASYEQLTNPSEQHFISAQQLCFQTFLIPARDSN